MEKQDTFRAVVLIPAYKPDERLVQLTRELKEEKLDVLLVDDGGQQAFAHIFDECRALGAEVAVHAVNQGKGRALKTGLNAALNLWPDLSGVVTADADGQHTLRDILRQATPDAARLLVQAIGNEQLSFSLRIDCAKDVLNRIYGKQAPPEQPGSVRFVLEEELERYAK